MIISQTPYRVSLAGGGTDLPAFYQHEYGAVLSLTIARHMYVTVHGRFQPNLRVAYSRTEIVDQLSDLQHDLVREAMRIVGIDEPLEITTIGDVPGGTGMGSSSTLTVGILNALYAYRSQIISRERLADEACRIEIDVLGHPIGKQDQYAAAFGGINFIRFNPDGAVDVEPVPCSMALIEKLQSHALLLYTNNQRDANAILQQQSDGTRDRMSVLRQMRDLASQLRNTLAGEGDLDQLSELLHQGWLLKRSLGFGISGEMIDQWYDAARKHGATGGKLLGAGGGGFMFLLAPPDRHQAIRAALNHPRELPFRIDRLGSRIVFISEQH